MLRGFVLAFALTLAAVTQLVFAPSASADGGLLSGLTDALTGGSEPSHGDEPGLLGGLLDTTEAITQPLTGNLLDPVTGTLAPIAEDLDEALPAPASLSLEETVSDVLTPLQQLVTEAEAPLVLLTPEEPEAPAANEPVSAPPGPALLEPVGDLLGAVLPPMGMALGESSGALTAPLEPAVDGIAAPLVGAPESVTPGLLPLANLGEALSPVLASLIPVLEPVNRLTNAVIQPAFALVEPVVTPVLRALQPVLQPIAVLLRPIGSPVVGVILPERAPGTAPQEPRVVAPPPQGQAPAAGLQTETMTEVASQSGDLSALASQPWILNAAVAAGQSTGSATGAIDASKRVQALVQAWTALAFNEQSTASVATSAPGSGITVIRAGAGSEDSDGSSLRIKAPAADLSQLIVLALAACLVFLSASGTRSRSWIKCPVRPPI